MTRRVSKLRYLALAFVGHAQRVLDRKEVFWAQGMGNEVQHIEDDRRALGWALGCIFASYRETFTSDALVTHALKAILIALIFCFAYENFLGPAQAAACYVHLPQTTLNFLANLPTDKIICVSWSSTPIAMLIISLAAGALYTASGFQLLRNRVHALHCYVIAFGVGLIAFLFEQGLPALSLHRHSGDLENIFKHVAVSQAIVPVLVAVAMWLASLQKRQSCE